MQLFEDEKELEGGQRHKSRSSVGTHFLQFVLGHTRVGQCCLNGVSAQCKFSPLVIVNQLRVIKLSGRYSRSEPKPDFPTNAISNQKYTVLNFVPLVLFN